MAKTRRGRTHTRVEIVDRTLEDLADDLEELSERTFKRVVYSTLDEVALDAQKRLDKVFEATIEGGPARFTKIRLGSKASSVVANRAEKRKGGRAISSSLKVQDRQSAYLKFALAGEDTRDAGDVGVAVKYNFVPNEKALATHQGVKLTPEGNLPRNALKGLSRRSQRKPDADRTKAGKKLGRDATEAERLAERKKRLARKRKPGDGLFFGQSGRRKTWGYWQRSDRDGEDSDRAPHLLVLAIPESEYDDDALVLGWNRSATDAMENLPRIARKRMAEVLASMS